MNLFGMMELSGGAMRAERIRAEVVAANMANAETTRTADGVPYRRQHVVFAAVPQPQGYARSLVAASFPESPTNPLELVRPAGIEPKTSGVEIAAVMADPAPPLVRFDPGHPDADANGYVAYPDINPVNEMVDLMGATRAYGLNNAAVQAEKAMIGAALDLAKS